MVWSAQTDKDGQQCWVNADGDVTYHDPMDANNWKEIVDSKSGDKYFVNKHTGETSWTKPGWCRLFDDESGQYFWYNETTNETSWDKPEGVTDDSIESIVSTVSFFSHLRPAELNHLCSFIKRVHFDQAQTIYSEGEADTRLFIVTKGQVQLTISSFGNTATEKVLLLNSGDTFGELAIMKNKCRRTATAKAINDVDVLVLEKDDFQSLNKRSWMRSCKQRLIQDNKSRMAQFLAEINFFENLPAETVLKLGDLFELMSVEDGDLVIQEGSRGDSFFVVVHGTFEVSVRHKLLATLNPGDYFGEMALLNDVPCTATVRSIGEALLFCLHRQAFTQFVRNVPELYQRLRSLMSKRTAGLVQRLKIPIFENIYDEVLQHLSTVCTHREYPAGSVICQQGRMGAAAFILTRGVVNATTVLSNGDENQKQFGSGACFGQACLVKSCPYAESVITATNCSVIQVRLDDIASAFKPYKEQRAAFFLKVLTHECDLKHIIAHSQGYESFLKFLNNKIPPIAFRFAMKVYEFQSQPIMELNRRRSVRKLTQLGFDEDSGVTLLGNKSLIQEILDEFSDEADYSDDEDEEDQTKLSEAFPEFQGISSNLQQLLDSNQTIPITCFDSIVLSIEEKCKDELIQFKKSPRFSSLLAGLSEDLKSSHRRLTMCKEQTDLMRKTFNGGETGKLADSKTKGTYGRCKVTLKNRYGSDKDRFFEFDLNLNCLQIVDQSGTVHHQHRLLSIEKLERTMDERFLRIVFRDTSGGKKKKNSTILEPCFETKKARDTFCVVAHILEPDLVVSDPCEKFESKDVVSYEVAESTGNSIKTRILSLDLVRQTLGIRTPDEALASTMFPLATLRLQPSITNDRTLHISSCPNESYPDPIPLDITITFPSAAVRERFAGTIRVICRGFDINKIRSVGLNEVDFTKGDNLKIFTASFNVGDGHPPAGPFMEHWIPSKPDADILVVALQECQNKEDWIKQIYQHIAPNETVNSGSKKAIPESGSTGFLSKLGRRQTSSASRSQELRKTLTSTLQQDSNGFMILETIALRNIVLAVYVRKNLLHKISQVQSDKVATGIAGIVGNKGGACISFLYDMATPFAFVSSHLAARSTRVPQRAANYGEICKSLHVGHGDRGLEFLHKFSHVFWLGDLNYRIDFGKSGTPQEFRYVVGLAEAGRFSELVEQDQLNSERNQGNVFASFQEGSIDFAPTYRMIKNGHGYSNKKNQNPSYTDRILWRSLPGFKSNVRQLSYNSAPQILSSDHSPVFAQFEVKTRLPFFNVPKETNFMHDTSSSITFGDLTFTTAISDDVIEAEENADANQSSKKASVPQTGPHDKAAELRVHAPFITNASQVPNFTDCKKEKTWDGHDMKVWNWKHKSIAPVPLFLAEPSYLQHEHVVLSVRTKKAVFGQAELPLKDITKGLAHHRPQPLVLRQVLSDTEKRHAFTNYADTKGFGGVMSFLSIIDSLNAAEDISSTNAMMAKPSKKCFIDTFESILEVYIISGCECPLPLKFSTRMNIVNSKSSVDDAMKAINRARDELVIILERRLFPAYQEYRRNLDCCGIKDSVPFEVPVYHRGAVMGVLKGSAKFNKQLGSKERYKHIFEALQPEGNGGIASSRSTTERANSIFRETIQKHISKPERRLISNTGVGVSSNNMTESDSIYGEYEFEEEYDDDECKEECGDCCKLRATIRHQDRQLFQLNSELDDMKKQMNEMMRQMNTFMTTGQTPTRTTPPTIKTTKIILPTTSSSKVPNSQLQKAELHKPTPNPKHKVTFAKPSHSPSESSAAVVAPVITQDNHTNNSAKVAKVISNSKSQNSQKQRPKRPPGPPTGVTGPPAIKSSTSNSSRVVSTRASKRVSIFETQRLRQKQRLMNQRKDIPQPLERLERSSSNKSIPPPPACLPPPL
eukprot:TRINITY_DN5895_c0_g3_i1.p1 TRINITY_DN5895_c0_g3~~TRINITY_DN5895_c0_g3_i1.p1  ORF type:complete len:1899 (+),score=565.67 TRINITY_DN5895_c0_g3_i1:99-5795(+)